MRSHSVSILAAIALLLGACTVDVEDGDESVADGRARIFDVDGDADGDGEDRDFGAADDLSAAPQSDSAATDGQGDAPGVAELKAIGEPDPQPWEPDERDDEEGM
jgi:hypothetical protein